MTIPDNTPDYFEPQPHKYFKNFSVEYSDDDVVLVSGIEIKRYAAVIKAPRNVFYICHQGYIVIETAETEYTLHAGETFICPTGTYFRLKYADPDAVFSGLALTDRILQSLLNTNMHLWNNIIYVLRERVARPQDKELLERDQKMYWHFTELMTVLLSLHDHPFRKEMIYLMLQMGLLGFCARYNDPEAIQKQTPTQDTGATQSQIIFSKFMQLLQAEKHKHQPVAYFSDKLCISPKYLSYVCKTIAGKSAREFIQSAVVGDIINYLENTTLSIKEISNILGFPNISFFGKYVKTHLGVSPNKYRK